MLILFDRLLAFTESNKLPLLPISKRKELGKLVAEAYHDREDSKPLKLVPFTEQGKRMCVLSYPADFQDQMDAIISKFYQENPVKIRKRIPAGPRRAFTSKLLSR